MKLIYKTNLYLLYELKEGESGNFGTKNFRFCGSQCRKENLKYKVFI